jgi:putative phosphoesterase
VRLGFLSDAHGNDLGVERVLGCMASAHVDRIHFLGDAVGYLPGESRVLGLLREAGVECQRGNHEAMLLGERPFTERQDRVYRLGDARARLSEADRAFLTSWPSSRLLEEDGTRILLVHGSPANHLEGYVYPDTDLSPFEEGPYDVVFMGHTHRPFAREQNGRLFVNVGSCGLPRDHGSLLSYAIYDTNSGSLEVHRVRIDMAAVVAHLGRARIADEVLEVMARQPAGMVFGSIRGDEAR